MMKTPCGKEELAEKAAAAVFKAQAQKKKKK